MDGRMKGRMDSDELERRESRRVRSAACAATRRTRLEVVVVVVETDQITNQPGIDERRASQPASRLEDVRMRRRIASGEQRQGGGIPRAPVVPVARSGAVAMVQSRLEAGSGRRWKVSDSSWVLHAKRMRSWLRALGRRVPRDSTLIIWMEYEVRGDCHERLGRPGLGETSLY